MQYQTLGTRQGHGLMKVTAEEVKAYVQSLPTLPTNVFAPTATDTQLKNITPRSLLIQKRTKLNFGDEKLAEKEQVVVSTSLYCTLFLDTSNLPYYSYSPFCMNFVLNFFSTHSRPKFLKNGDIVFDFYLLCVFFTFWMILIRDIFFLRRRKS